MPFENPFTNYQPPDVDDMFSDSGKLAIIKFKLEGIMAGVRRGLSQGDRIDRFVSGDFDFRYRYDCFRLRPYLRFPNPEVELKIVGRAVGAGISETVRATQSPSIVGALEVTGDFDDEDCRIALIYATFHNQSEPDIEDY